MLSSGMSWLPLYCSSHQLNLHMFLHICVLHVFLFQVCRYATSFFQALNSHLNSFFVSGISVVVVLYIINNEPSSKSSLHCDHIILFTKYACRENPRCFLVKIIMTSKMVSTTNHIHPLTTTTIPSTTPFKLLSPFCSTQYYFIITIQYRLGKQPSNSSAGGSSHKNEQNNARL